MSTADDLDTTWLDMGWWLQADGSRRLLSWNADTHELKFWRLRDPRPGHELERRDRDLVLAVIDTEDEVVRRLEGWAAYNETKEGLAWLAGRLEGCR